MKALLVAVNAKYIHTSLSVRTLKAYANSDNVEMAEYTINERVEDILRSIFLKKADVVLFSCYIWNVEVCLDVADMLKRFRRKQRLFSAVRRSVLTIRNICKSTILLTRLCAARGKRPLKNGLKSVKWQTGLPIVKTAR